MPTYTTRCAACANQGTIRMSYVDYESVKMGVKSLVCGVCSGVVHIEFNPGNVQFIQKDGESGGWASKANKENAYRKLRADVMRKRTRDHVFKSKLIPNYKGEETGTWKAAQEEARREHGAAGAQTYDPLVREQG